MMSSIISVFKRKLASILALPRTKNDLDKTAIAGEVVDTQSNEHNDDVHDDRPHKRQRRSLLDDDDDDDATTATGTATPYLLSESARFPPQLHSPSEELLLKSANVGVSHADAPPLVITLTHLPSDILFHCLYYIHTRSDRFGLQVSCKTLYHVSNTDKMLAVLDLGGDVASIAHQRGATNVYGELDVDNITTVIDNDDGDDDNPDAFVVVRRLQMLRHRGNLIGGNGNDDDGVIVDHAGASSAAGAVVPQSTKPPQSPKSITDGLILDCDTSESACFKLVKFAAAGNVQAIYMIAMILCYCHENIPEGVKLLSHAAKSLHAPSIYALALILRDSCDIESDRYLDIAASLDYAPAWQEKLSAAEMRARFGDLDANALLPYMDPPCLNSLLGRHYLECSRARKRHTSHCWNPSCGRWAYKAMRVAGGGDGANFRQIRMARLRPIILWREQNQDNERDIGGVNIDNRIDHQQQQLHILDPRQDFLEPMNRFDRFVRISFGNDGHGQQPPGQPLFSIEPLVAQLPNRNKRRSSIADSSSLSSTLEPSPLNTLLEVLRTKPTSTGYGLKVSRMKMCSSCRRAKYCSKLCQVFDWRSGKHKMECQFL